MGTHRAPDSARVIREVTTIEPTATLEPPARKVSNPLPDAGDSSTVGMRAGKSRSSEEHGVNAATRRRIDTCAFTSRS